MKSLLNKSLTQFIVCTVAILILTLPLFYLLTKSYYAEELKDVIATVGEGKHIPPLDLEEDILVGLMIQFGLIFVILSASFVITMRFITRRLWRPFDSTLKKIEQFNLGKSDIPNFETTDIEEFHRLNESVGILMEKDKRTYQSQKEFTENASHELQTPLAVLQGKLDLLLQEELNESQSGIVEELYGTVQRMSRINKDLLLLARIENSQYAERQPVRLDEMIERLIPQYEGLCENRNIHFTKAASSPIIANATLLESLLNNLVVNAIRHSTRGNAIEITLSEHSLTVSNESDGTALDESRIFERFKSTAEEGKGNGLGLSIVKAICDFHGWKIKYKLRNGWHCFDVAFTIDK